MKRNAIAASLCAEMAQLLKAKQLKNPSSSQSFNFITLFQKLEKFGEAAEFFQQAAEIQQTESPLNAIVSLEDAVQCHVQLRDYKAGCAALIWITKLAGEMLSVQNEGINQFFCFLIHQIFNLFSKQIGNLRIPMEIIQHLQTV